VVLPELDLENVNQSLRDAGPREIIDWAAGLGLPVIATTSFGRNAAVMLDLLSGRTPPVPVVWVDTGYNLRDTYVVAEKLMQRLDLQMHIYTPTMTAERRNAIMGGIPPIDDEQRHRQFTRQVKLEPFDRAIQDVQPDVWLTGIRRDETEHRRTLDIVSRDDRGMLKVAPLFYWSERDMEDYRARSGLPSCRHYFDPTKVYDGRECGLHTAA